MENIEEIIKNKLSHSSSLDGIDQDLLWNNIVESTIPPRKKKKRLLLLWLFPLAAVIGIGIYIDDQQKNERVISKNDAISKKVERSNPEIVDRSQQEETAQIQKIQIRSDVNSTIVSNSATKTVVQPSNHKIDQDAPILLVKNDIAINSSKGQTLNNSVAVKMEENVVATSQVEKSRSESLFRKMPKSIPTDFGLANAAHTSLAPTIVPIGTGFNNARNHFGLSCYSGMALIQNKFQNQTNVLADTLSKFIKGEIGFNSGANLTFYHKKNWFIAAGFEFSNWRDRFDALLISDTIVQINQQNVQARNFRTIRHTNTASMLTIPLQIGMFKDYKKIRIAMQIGASYTFVVEQKGRMLSDLNSVFDYSQSTKRYHNFYSLRISPAIGYKLNEKLMMDVHCNFGLQNHKQTDINTIKSRSLAIMPSIGFTYNY